MAPYCLPGAELPFSILLSPRASSSQEVYLNICRRFNKIGNGRGLTIGNLVPLQGLGIQSLWRKQEDVKVITGLFFPTLWQFYLLINSPACTEGLCSSLGPMTSCLSSWSQSSPSWRSSLSSPCRGLRATGRVLSLFSLSSIVAAGAGRFCWGKY